MQILPARLNTKIKAVAVPVRATNFYAVDVGRYRFFSTDMQRAGCLERLLQPVMMSTSFQRVLGIATVLAFVAFYALNTI